MGKEISLDPLVSHSLGIDKIQDFFICSPIYIFRSSFWHAVLVHLISIRREGMMN
jgi:hypothetical protein